MYVFLPKFAVVQVVNTVELAFNSYSSCQEKWPQKTGEHTV